MPHIHDFETKARILKLLRPLGAADAGRNNAEAEALLDAALQERPDDADLVYISGLLAHMRSEEDTAARFIEKAITMSGGQPAFGPKPPLPPLGLAAMTFSILQHYNQIQSFRTGAINVFFTQELDGGGAKFGQEYVNTVYDLFAKEGRVFRRVHEFCAGPGFIGFSLLAHGLCQTLSLSDVHPKAVRAMRYTVSENRLEGLVDVYESDSLEGIPDNEVWDLVVSNPPHFPNSRTADGDPDRLTRTDVDLNWEIHKRFYSRVAKHLAPDGIALLQEFSGGSSPEDFAQMITEAGLKPVRAIQCQSHNKFYYVWSEHS